MPVMLQVRNLPDDIHAKLKQRAKDVGLTLSDFVAQELAALVETKSNRDVVAAVRASRKERDEQIWSSTHPHSSTS